MRTSMRLPTSLFLLAASVAAGVLAGPLAPEARAFRNVPVGAALPAGSVLDLDGAKVAVPPSGAAAVLVFFRPGQRYSTEALSDLEAVRKALPGKLGVFAIAEAGSDRAAVREAARAAGLETRVLVDDPEASYAEALGAIVLPSAAVVSAEGRLAAYFPGRSAHFRDLVEARARVLLGEMTEAEYAVRAERAGETGSSQDRARTLEAQALAHAQKGEWEDAKRDLATAIALLPDDTNLNVQLGFVLLDAGEVAEAARIFGFALSRNAASPRARLGLGIARVREKKTDEGIALIEAAIQLNPDPTRGYYELGRAYEEKGDLVRALAAYKFAVRKLLQGRS